VKSLEEEEAVVEVVLVVVLALEEGEVTEAKLVEEVVM
jgi:hypothetical protein